MEFAVDNRILLGLSEVAGDQERNLDKVFIFKNKVDGFAYFATDGYIAMRVEVKEPEFDFEDLDCVIEIPTMIKKVLRYNSKEYNDEMNKTIVKFFGDEVYCRFFNIYPYSLNFNMSPQKKFEALPDVFNAEAIEQRAIAFNPSNAQKINKALIRLGFKSLPTFMLGDMKMVGNMENEDFVVEFVLIGGRPDAE